MSASGRRAGWATFYRGLIADNLQGQPASRTLAGASPLT